MAGGMKTEKLGSNLYPVLFFFPLFGINNYRSITLRRLNHTFSRTSFLYLSLHYTVRGAKSSLRGSDLAQPSQPTSPIEFPSRCFQFNTLSLKIHYHHRKVPPL